MQTNFSPEQLRDPNFKRSNEVLRSCVHCGFCTATCPTYKILGDETLFDVIFSKNTIKNYRDYILADSVLYQKFSAALRSNGVLKPPGKIYVSSVLVSEDFDQTEEAIRAATALKQ
mgnify:CR=1 FL=1